jgi:hypothetical protein
MNFWPFFNRYLERSFVHFISITTIVVVLICLMISCLTPFGQRTIFGTDVGHDYASRYIAGKILNEHHPTELYNDQLQSEIYHALFPYLPGNINLPNPYPPFFNLLFRPLALLPYIYSYLMWLLISAALYMIGLICIVKSIRALPEKYFLTFFLLAFSFEPFLVECWIGGETSVFGFMGFSLSYFFYKRRRCILAGCALGICFYKPTLLIIILPILLVIKQYKIIWGIVLSGMTLILISFITVGWDTCLKWFYFAFGFVKYSAGKTEILSTYKYVDIVAFLRLLLGRFNESQWIVLLVIYLIWSFYFLFSLKKIKTECFYIRDLLIASILTWTAVINIYFPIYDTVILVIGVVITINSLYHHSSDLSSAINSNLKSILCLLYLTPWITQYFAKYIGFQPYTLILIAFGIYQLLMARQLSANKYGSSPI